ncbi:unnamed protein product [Medioppia subpectinata]|uniref:Chitin-binding type-4 domain-containing protein n=1 Tax=Medioppia subpectinata TaxID=1979941 RepID=A0A7R9PVX1_9ACAR|nr:unnamed protein product [Medioppia subpectinata]CAG2103300.1 unnamed protein product [Medioppia subpectinata]
MPNYNQYYASRPTIQIKRLAVRYQRDHGGKCGICGDRVGGPLENELPNGQYAKNLVITRKYKVDQTIEVKVELTANHAGHFQFKLCPATSKQHEVSQDCLDKHTLLMADGGSDRYTVPSEKPRIYTIGLRLPSGVRCDRCWTYTAGNDWMQCPDGSHAVGCGVQETFRGCADIAIN